MTRAYHGEHIREKQWQRMFRPRLNAVIPMDHRYLAENDGSELASGRGSGQDKITKPGEPRQQQQHSRVQIPYMNMTYAPIERRLDMAIWRSLFASSARQARQFVIHGNVKVNGQKVCLCSMPYSRIR
jgi:ribosomal protein S4